MEGASANGDGEDTDSVEQTSNRATSNNELLQDEATSDQHSKPSKSPMESPEIQAANDRQSSVLKEVEEQTLRKRTQQVA